MRFFFVGFQPRSVWFERTRTIDRVRWRRCGVTEKGRRRPRPAICFSARRVDFHQNYFFCSSFSFFLFDWKCVARFWRRPSTVLEISGTTIARCWFKLPHRKEMKTRHHPALFHRIRSRILIPSLVMASVCFLFLCDASLWLAGFMAPPVSLLSYWWRRWFVFTRFRFVFARHNSSLSDGLFCNHFGFNVVCWFYVFFGDLNRVLLYYNWGFSFFFNRILLDFFYQFYWYFLLCLRFWAPPSSTLFDPMFT